MRGPRSNANPTATRRSRRLRGANPEHFDDDSSQNSSVNSSASDNENEEDDVSSSAGEEAMERFNVNEDDDNEPAAGPSNHGNGNAEDGERDLTHEEMDKLVQLQDITGIDDLNICRALLESKNWDLEATAREQLNLPEANQDREQRPPRPLEPHPEAPESASSSSSG